MSISSGLKLIHLGCLSQPAHERRLYRTVYRDRVARILELGVGTASRAQRMLAVASMRWPSAQLRYVGIDPFEARSAADGPGLSLKLAHRILCATGAKVKLVPGDPSSALARVANTLPNNDLVVISSLVAPEHLQQAWFWLPRMLHPGSRVFKEEHVGPGRMVLGEISLAEVKQMATPPIQRAA